MATRRWVKVIGTKNVFLMTPILAEKVGITFVEVTEEQAVALTLERDADNKARAGQIALQRQEESLKQVRQPTDIDPKKAAAQQPGAPKSNLPPVKPAAEVDLSKPWTPEQVEAQLSKPEEPISMQVDDLDDLSKKELVSVIDSEELPVNRSGRRDELMTRIREARTQKAANAPSTPA